MKRKLMAMILAGGMLVQLTACGQQAVEAPQNLLVEEEEEEAFPTTTAEYSDVTRTVKIRCNYTSTEKQELAFPMDGGLIKRVEVKMGDYVSAGQLLVELEVQELEERIEAMEYQVQSQELRLKQTQEMKAFELDSADIMFNYTFMTDKDKENLKEQKAGIEERYKTTLEDMTDQLTIQKQRLQQCREELESGQLYAEITGEITYLQNELQDTYSKKDRVVVTVSNLDACYFVAEGTDYAEYFREDVSHFISYRESGTEYSSEVVPAIMDQWNDKMYFKVVGEEIIASETNGTLILEIGHRENVLCVPEDAVHESDQGPFVYLVNGGLLEMRYVTVGLVGDDFTEITGGLEQGEIVALEEK